MEAAFAWLGQLMEWVGRFFPRITIAQANEAGVRWKYGRHVEKVEPGIRVFWPLVTPSQQCRNFRYSWTSRTVRLPQPKEVWNSCRPLRTR